jgi:hypothetical protein
VDESVEGDGSGSTKCINSFSDTKRGNTGSVSDWASVSNIEELNDQLWWQPTIHTVIPFVNHRIRSNPGFSDQ